MVRKISLAFALFTVLSTGTGCGDPVASEPVRIDHVTRVLMHQPGDYTLLVTDPATKAVTLRTFYDWCTSTERGVGTTTQILADVPEGQALWAEQVTWQWSLGKTCNELKSIHLHSAQDIGGAGWNNGKFGSGQTTVVGE